MDQKTKNQSEIKIAIFKKNPFDSRLATHHLHGKLKNQLSFSVNARYRILFEFLDKKQDEIVFLDIGTHDLYK